MNASREPKEDCADRTPLWALIGAPLLLFLASSGAFWGAYSWMSATNPLPKGGTTVMAAARPPAKSPTQVADPAPVPNAEVRPPLAPRLSSRRATSPIAPSVAVKPTAEPAAIPEPRRAEPAPQRPVQAPCPIHVTASQLAQGKAVSPPAGRRVAIVLHRSGGSAEGNHEAERQVIAVVHNLAPADSFTVVTTAGQGSVFASEPVAPQPESVEALRSWMKALPGGATTPLETGVSTALAMPAINKVVVVADVAPEREAETFRRLSDVVRTGNRFGAAVSAVTVTPRCTPAVAPAKGQGASGEEPPSVAREVVVGPGL
jgi:hypothetical protein